MKEDVTSRAPERNATDVQFPLPDDLRLVALEYNYRLPELPEDVDERPPEHWLPMYALVRELDGEVGQKKSWTDEDIYYLRIYGDRDHDDAKTIFGEVRRGIRCRVNVVTTRADAERWAEDEFALFEAIGWSSDVQLMQKKILDRLPAVRGDTKGDDYFADEFLSPERYKACLKDGSKHDTDPAKAWALLKEHWDEDFVGTVRKWVKTDADLERFRQLKEACRGDLGLVGRQLARLHAQQNFGPVEFLVDGLIPKNNIALLLGNKGVGKSAWLLELACAAATGRAEFMGRKLNPGTGLVAFFYGEDSPQEVDRRAKLICGGAIPPRLMLIPYGGQPVEEMLKTEVGSAALDLLVVDPARKFYEGNEDSSQAANDFMNALGKFNENKGAAVVVAHHLRRNAGPRSVDDVLAAMRGSQAIQDRPRVILAMFRVRDVTTIGVGVHNFDEAVMIPRPVRLRRDAATFRHVPAEDEAPDAAEAKLNDAVERVHVVLARLRAVDPDKPPPGADTLFKLNAPELAGMTRAEVRDALHLATSPARGETTVGEGDGEGSSG
jgi:AAA domain